MAEIKNTFTQGKMNKDLDERILPNGQYRDAMNVEITTSEGSDVGTVQNILGNNTVEQFVPASGYKCVGSISDEKTNSLYWFVKGNNIEAVLQYSLEEGIKPVIIDTKAGTADAVLKFPNKIITGINIVNNLLLWTDGVNEPRRINIDRCKQGNTTSNSLTSSSHTKLIVQDQDVGDLQEDHITAIKKSPLKPISYTIDAAALDVKKPLFEKIFPRFSYRYKFVDGEYSTFAPFTEVVFNSLYSNDISGENVYTKDNAYNIEDPYNNGMRNMIQQINLYNFVAPNIPKDVVEIDLLYKQDDSSVVYVLENIKNTSEHWNSIGLNVNSGYKGSFTVKSENIYAALPENQSLRIWDALPKSAISQEVSGNRVVYGNYKQGYDLLDTNNTIVNPSVTASYRQREVLNYDEELGGIQSLKSQRDYQVGIVYGDKYGRETPVFTNEDSSFRVDWPDASSANQITAAILSEHPHWADYYKFFVKETSGEYYNLIMDAIYTPTVEDLDEINENHVWLSFPSSDRNKVKEEDYIILKRSLKESIQIVKENKYKVLDVKNEAPESIKYKYLKYGEILDGNAPAGGIAVSLNNDLFTDAEKRPTSGNDYLLIDKNVWVNDSKGQGMSLTVTEEETSVKDGDLFISFNRIEGTTSVQTERYKISAVRLSNGNVYLIKLEKPISEVDANSIVDANGDFLTSVTVVIEKKIVKNLEAFSGRFFVKVAKRGEITELQDIQEAEIINRVSATTSFHWHTDTINASGDHDPNTGVINSDSLHSSNPTDDANATFAVGNLTNTETDWQSILDNTPDSKLFLDNLFFAAVQPVLDDEKAYARFSGQVYNAGTPGFVDIGEGDIIYPTYVSGSGTSTIVDLPIPSGYRKHSNLDNVNNPPHRSSMSFPQKNVIKPQDPGANGENMINSIDGLIDTTANHMSDGIKVWRKSLVLENQPGFINQEYSYYGSTTGRKFLHISFLAPGEDLHDNTGWPSDGDLTPFGVRESYESDAQANNLSSHLQGIWGGGIVTKEDGTDFSGVGNNQAYLESLVSIPTSSGIIKAGYNELYRQRHINQWKPEYSGGVYDANVKKIIDRIKNPGNKFRFKVNGGTDFSETFTIKNTYVVRLYNHTPWRKTFKWDGVTDSGAVTATNTSVEKAVEDLCNKVSQGSSADRIQKENDLKQKIVDFGNRNNRRVCYIIELTDDSPDITFGDFNPTSTSGDFQLSSASIEDIEFIDGDFNLLNGDISQNPAIWETEPKESADLDIYYEASQAYPTKLTTENNELFAPVGSELKFNFSGPTTGTSFGPINEPIKIKEWISADTFTIIISPTVPGVNTYTGVTFQNILDYVGKKIRFIRPDGSFTRCTISAATKTLAQPLELVYDTFTVTPDTRTGLNWHNCFSFGNGIESDRIRDDFNAMKIAKGVIANSTIDRTYKEEHKQNGLIYSGIYSSTGLINSLNEFISAEKITKDLNPTFGSIQKLFQRRISLIAFCEDRVVSIVSNKDALFNADGNPQLISSTSVLGDATPFVGDYGISKNPESFSKEGYRAYFTDKQRGAVLRLSMDGLTPISDAGMKDYFRDNLDIPNQIIGSYDAYKQDYNLTLANYLPENVIQNNLIEQGQGESIETFIDTELIDNNSFNSGTAISNPSPPSNIAENSDLRTVTNIFNYDLIPAGSLQAAQTEVTAQNWNFGTPDATNRVIFEFINDDPNSNFGSSNSQGVYDPRFNGVIAPLTNPSTVYLGETGDRKSQARLEAIFTGPDGPDPNARAKFTINGQGKPFFRNSITDGLGASSFVDGLFFRTQDLDQSLVDPDVLAATNPALPITSNTTTFNGEEYKFSMYIQNYDVNGNEDVNLVINICEGGGQINGAFLVAGDAATVGTTNTPTDDPTYSNDINMGWVTDSSITLPNFPEGSHRIEFYLKAGNPDEGIHVNTSDPNNKVILAPIFDYLNIHFSHDDPIKNNSILIREFKVEKIKKLTHPGRLFVPGIPAQPPSDIPAHTVVRQDGLITTGASGSGGWSATVDANATVAEAILDQGAINEFGDDNYPATTVTYDIIDNDPTSATYGQDIGDGTYLTGNPNGVSDYFSQGFVTTNTPGTGGVDVTIDITNADGSVIGKRGGFGRPGNVISIVADGDGETVQLTQDITSNPLVVDNWYELKLTGVTGVDNNTSILVMDALDSTTFPNNLPPDPRGETLPGHIGEIAGSQASPKQIKLVQDGSDLRCIWQQKHNGNLNELKINFFRCDVTVDAIEFADVTDKQTGGVADSWNTLNPSIYHYYSPRKRVYLPSVASGLIRWGYDSNGDGTIDEPGYGSGNPLSEIIDANGNYKANYALQNIDLAPTNDGYILTFQVILANGGTGNTGTLSGYLTGGYEDVDPGQTYGVEFTVQQGGRYRIEGNLDGVTQPTITRVDADYITPASGTDSSLMSVAIKTFPGPGHADKLLFAPVAGGEFLGDLLECSVKDATNYFTPTTADSWIFDGFDPNFENFITFDDVNQNILFTNAPNTVSLQQAINTNFPTGSVVQLKFDVENHTSGSISGYYYNQDGEGFTFGPINNNTNFDSESDLANRITIGDSTATGGEILNTLVIFVESGDFNAALDNFELYRIYPDYTPTTITYSEDVKGWTSFKSFVPEVGVNLSSKYYTFKNAKLYKHYFEGVDYNTFYGEHVESSITAVLNQQPDTIKIFNALSYEGTQSKINQYTIDTDTGLTNASIYNLNAKDGWYAANIVTDKQSGSIKEFIEKEGKWFNYIKGAEILDTQLPSTAEFSFQGLGIVSITETI